METTVLKIDRSVSLNIGKFERQTSRVYHRKYEQSPQSLALTEIDVSHIELHPESIRKRLGKHHWTYVDPLEGRGYVRLDVKIMETLLENQEMIPTSWQRKRKPIFFMGTAFRKVYDLKCYGGTPSVQGFTYAAIFYSNKRWNCWGLSDDTLRRSGYSIVIPGP